MKTRVLAIAPYEGMKELMREAAKGRDDMELKVEVGDLYSGLEAVRRNAQGDYDVVVSRGGTARLIAEKTDMPVIEISISVYDILCAIRLAQNYTGSLAVVGYPNITEPARQLCDVMQYPIQIVTLSADTDVSACLKRLIDEGCQLIISDMIASTVAKKLGLNANLVTSGSESISTAFDQAIRLSRAFNYTRRQKEILRTLFSESQEDVFIFYPDGRLWFSTLSDEERETRMMESLRDELPAFLADNEYRIERPQNQQLVSMRCRHIEVYGKKYVMLFHRTRDLFVSDDSDSGILLYGSDTESGDNPAYYCNSSNVGCLRDSIQSYGASGFPILITGEAGTGKSRTATMLYERSLYNDKPYYIVDCTTIGKRRWCFLLESEDSPLNGLHTVVFFRRIDCLGTERTSELIDYIEQGGVAQRNRLFFSYQFENADEEVSPECRRLADSLSCLILRIPPLRERVSDIPGITVLFLNQLNISLGKQIIGFEQDAMQRMQAFSWPGNLEQFKRVLNELVVLAGTPYISGALVESVLRQEGPVSVTACPPGYAAVNLQQSLRDIDRDILRSVLASEGMNQSRAASRLGISRTTLWRMLREE